MSFSGGIPGSCSKSQLDIMNDPVVKALELLLRVRERGGPAYPPLCHRRVVSCVPPPLRRHSGAGSETEAEESRNPGVALCSRVSGAETDVPGFVPFALVSETAESRKSGVAHSSRVSGAETDLLELVPSATGGETLESLSLGVSRAARACRRARPCSARETACESKGIIGLREVIVSGSSLPVPINSSSSSGCVNVDACARYPALPIASASLSSSASAPASLAVVAYARSTPLHVAHNSWSDTGRVKVPREGGVPKVRFPVRPKICALSQRRRQG